MTIVDSEHRTRDLTVLPKQRVQGIKRFLDSLRMCFRHLVPL